MGTYRQLWAVGWVAASWVALGSTAAVALAAEFRVEASRGQLWIGDPFVVDLRVTAPAGAPVQVPRPAERLGPFEVLEWLPVTVDTLADGHWLHSHRARVAAFGVGPLSLPPLAATVGVGERAIELTSDSLTVHVGSVLEAAGADTAADIRALKPPLSLPVPRPWAMWLGLAALALLAGLAVAWWKWRRSESVPAVAQVVDSRSPERWALDELLALEAQALPAQAEIKRHYTLLADVLRGYLERRFQVPASERTTGELLATLAARTPAVIDGDSARRLAAILGEADLVKFAKRQPAAAAAMGVVGDAREFVADTSPPPGAAVPHNGGTP